MQILRIARCANALQAGMIACLLVLPGTRLLGEDDERAKWISDHWKVVEDAKIARDENSIRELGDIVGPLGRRLSELKPDTKELHDEAQRTLLSIPGHAIYFGNEITKLMDEQISQGFTHAHSSQRYWYFENLDQLPSPETVRVLGELLFDERDPWKDIPVTDCGNPQSNALYSAAALYRLGLKNPPLNLPYPNQEDLHTWQLWYQQIRAGTRTFSFKGDDQVYTLAGPVTGTPQPASSRARLRAPSATPTAAPQGPKAPFIAAVLVAVGAGLAVFWRAKHRRA